MISFDFTRKDSLSRAEFNQKWSEGLLETKGSRFIACFKKSNSCRRAQ
jgi:hypothetical protein